MSGGNSFGITMKTQTWYRFLYLETEVTENAGTFSISLYDNIMDSAANELLPVASEWEFNADYETSYVDEYWQADFFDMFFSSTPSWYYTSDAPLEWYSVSF